MSRRKIVAGNWKMNMDLESGKELVGNLLQKLNSIQKTEVVFCPPYPFLSSIYDMIQNSSCSLGGKDLYWVEKGAFTGEISAEILFSVGCKSVIVRHSERRKYFSETDEIVNRKIKRALQSNLIPIVCIGESLDQRQTNQTKDVIKTQLQNGLQGLSKEEIKKIILAYEPVWAIGTGKTATPEQAIEVHQYIRGTIKQWYDDQVAQSIRIIYGGSVSETNARELLSQPDIDGALVGGASLKSESFFEIIFAAEQSN